MKLLFTLEGARCQTRLPHSADRDKMNFKRTGSEATSMKTTNKTIVGLLAVIFILGIWILEQRLEIGRLRTSTSQIVSMNGSLGLYHQSNNQLTAGSSADGFWLYKDDEKQVYFFRYDPATGEIVQTKRNIQNP